MIILSDHLPVDPFDKKDCIGCFFHSTFETRDVCNNDKAVSYIIENRKCEARSEFDPYAEVLK